jgi:NAD(P)H-hydrate epimerase
MSEARDVVFFRTEDGIVVPAVTAEQMLAVDRMAVEEFGLGILQMMENAGRNLALNVMDMLDRAKASPEQRRRGEVTVLAGAGGNGGGGLCCARHLHNRGFKVWVVLDRDPRMLRGAAANQLNILQTAGRQPADPTQAGELMGRSQIVVDALIGYGLRGAPRGRTAELIELCNQHAARVLSLDVPSGLDATTGEAPGPVVRPERTLTLALPKTGLQRVPGDLYLADIGIPPEVFQRLGMPFQSPFEEKYWIPLIRTSKQGLKSLAQAEKCPQALDGCHNSKALVSRRGI